MGMCTDELALHRNPGQEATFRSKVEALEEEEATIGKPSRTLLLYTEDPPATYHKILKCNQKSTVKLES